jgi:hypothetical protein
VLHDPVLDPVQPRRGDYGDGGPRWRLGTDAGGQPCLRREGFADVLGGLVDAGVYVLGEEGLVAVVNPFAGLADVDRDLGDLPR